MKTLFFSMKLDVEQELKAMEFLGSERQHIANTKKQKEAAVDFIFSLTSPYGLTSEFIVSGSKNYLVENCWLISNIEVHWAEDEPIVDFQVHYDSKPYRRYDIHRLNECFINAARCTCFEPDDADYFDGDYSFSINCEAVYSLESLKLKDFWG